MHFKYAVDEGNSGRTIYSILKDEFKFSRRLITKTKRYKSSVTCNGIHVYVTHIVKPGDLVEANIDFEETSENIKPVKMDLDILYEDDAVIILNKPTDMVVNPIGDHLDKTIANGLMYYFMREGHSIKIRPVSRLDKDTTGIIVFAKNGFVHDRLRKQMMANEYHRKYIGIVHGCPKEQMGLIDLPIARYPGSVILRHICKSGAIARTHYKVVEYLDNATLVKFQLETGRTHQIRVHCQAIGHPLIGDTLYSDISSPFIERQALHSYYVGLRHPVSQKKIELSSHIPKDMEGLLEGLRPEKDI